MTYHIGEIKVYLHLSLQRWTNAMKIGTETFFGLAPTPFQFTSHVIINVEVFSLFHHATQDLKQ